MDRSIAPHRVTATLPMCIPVSESHGSHCQWMLHSCTRVNPIVMFVRCHRNSYPRLVATDWLRGGVITTELAPKFFFRSSSTPCNALNAPCHSNTEQISSQSKFDLRKFDTPETGMVTAELPRTTEPVSKPTRPNEIGGTQHRSVPPLVWCREQESNLHSQ